MLRAIGTCKSIENYSRHIAGRAEGEPSDCLIDYFGDTWLLVVDESHITIPQIKAMYFGDNARKVVIYYHPYSYFNFLIQLTSLRTTTTTKLFPFRPAYLYRNHCLGQFGEARI